MTDPKPKEILLVNDHEHMLQLAWTVPSGAPLEPIGGIKPMQPNVPRVHEVAPGLNYVSAESVAKAGGANALPSYVTVIESVVELRVGRMADEVIKRTAAPALRRWLAEEKRPEVRKAIEARISELAAKRAA